MAVTKKMHDELMAKITQNGELTKQSEINISKRISDFETNYKNANTEMEDRHKTEIATIKESFKKENDTIKQEINSVRLLIEGKSDNIKLSEQAVETAVKQVATDEFKKLKTSVTKACEQNNKLEQYTRNWCLRIYGVSISGVREAAVGPVRAAMEAVYDTVVQPVLEKVVTRGGSGLTSVPDLTDCIENSHKLGKEFISKGKTLPPCVIVRFTKRELRDLVIKNRKLVPAPGQDLVDAGVSMFRVVEDLTRTNYERLKGLIADERVEKVWTIQGNFRLILKNDAKKTVIKCKDSIIDIGELVTKYCG